jgi:hypothetical protein
MAIILACFCSQRCSVISSSLFHFAAADATLAGEILGVQKASDTLEMPFWCDKIQEASLFFSCKTSEANTYAPLSVCHPSAVLSSELVHSLFPLYPSKITYISSFTLLHIGSECRDLLFMTSN